MLNLAWALAIVFTDVPAGALADRRGCGIGELRADPMGIGPSEAPAYAGTDFIIVRDGRIAAVYLFFDKLP
jgi:hypothetical protein